MNGWQLFATTFLDFHAMGQALLPLVTVGLVNTLILAVSATLLGSLIGMLLALMGLSKQWFWRLPARVYTDLFRGLPAILTILVIGQGLSRFSQQLIGPNPYPLGILALALISGAYIGEIFRAGIKSIDPGQLAACRALGMSHAKAMRLVVIPQGIRRVLPALVNQFIAIVKDSSLVYFLGLLADQRELFRVGQDAAILNGNLSPLVLAGLFYLIITVPLTHLVNHFDARRGKRRRKRKQRAEDNRGTVRNKTSTPLHPPAENRS